MENEVKKISEQFGRKTVLLPNNLDSDCYAVYSKEEYKNPDRLLTVDGKNYKHRLYFYKKVNNRSDKILTFIFLNPGYSTHKKQNSEIRKCEEIAQINNYDAIEIFSVFTLRTADKIDAVSEDAILDVARADLSKNDIVLAYGDKIKRTAKYKNISLEDLRKINKVREIKINALLDFLKNTHKGKIFTLGLTKNGNPRTVQSGKSLVLFNTIKSL